MPDMVTMVARLAELSQLLSQMCEPIKHEDFRALQKKWDETTALYKLEDKLDEREVMKNG